MVCWYDLRVTVGYDTDYERVISQPVQEIEFFSNYNVFCDDHPVGISGRRVGQIHSNDKVEFHGTDGEYRYGVTAVKGVEYLNGATEGTRRSPVDLTRRAK